MAEVKQAPYGTWESPITPDHFASGSVILDQLNVNVRDESEEPVTTIHY